jgi:hypothetical protein
MTVARTATIDGAATHSSSAKERRSFNNSVVKAASIAIFLQAAIE